MSLDFNHRFKRQSKAIHSDKLSRFGKCTESDVAIKLSVDTEMLVIVNGSELVLLSPFGQASPLIIQTAQYSGEYPCLNPINYEQQKSECKLLQIQNCEPDKIVLEPRKVSKISLINKTNIII